MDMANYEIDQLRRSLSQMQKELVEAQNEAEVSKRRRDWAVSEKKKMILERESIRYLCDSLRKERNTRDRELSKALTDNDELKRQVKELSRQLSELKDKLEESNRLEKENHNNCSRDSAIDTDENLLGGAVGGQPVETVLRSSGNVLRSSGNVLRSSGNVLRSASGSQLPVQTGHSDSETQVTVPMTIHPGLTSSESELLELSMKHHSISDQGHHRPESRLTDPRFTTIDPIIHSQDSDHRTESHDRRQDRIPPRFPSLASEPASRPPSVAGDPFDPWTGPLPETYLAHSVGVHGSASGHHTPAGILTPGGHLTPAHPHRGSKSGHNSDQYLDVKPKPGEVRDIIVAKSSEPLGKVSLLINLLISYFYQLLIC